MMLTHDGDFASDTGFAAVRAIEFDLIEGAERQSALEPKASEMVCAILGRATPVTDIA